MEQGLHHTTLRRKHSHFQSEDRVRDRRSGAIEEKLKTESGKQKFLKSGSSPEPIPAASHFGIPNQFPNFLRKPVMPARASPSMAMVAPPSGTAVKEGVKETSSRKV